MWENDITNKEYICNEFKKKSVIFNLSGWAEFSDEFSYNPDDTFIVEVEEEIDEYTVFHTLVKVIEDGTVYTCTDATINREKNSAVVEIHAILNGVLKLIWTHEKGLVE